MKIFMVNNPENIVINILLLRKWNITQLVYIIVLIFLFYVSANIKKKIARMPQHEI